jgi:hypothetical protein
MLRRSTLYLQERRGKVNAISRIAIELDEHGAINDCARALNRFKICFVAVAGQLNAGR